MGEYPNQRIIYKNPPKNDKEVLMSLAKVIGPINEEEASSHALLNPVIYSILKSFQPYQRSFFYVDQAKKEVRIRNNGLDSIFNEFDEKVTINYLNLLVKLGFLEVIEYQDNKKCRAIIYSLPGEVFNFLDNFVFRANKKKRERLHKKIEEMKEQYRI